MRPAKKWHEGVRDTVVTRLNEDRSFLVDYAPQFTIPNRKDHIGAMGSRLVALGSELSFNSERSGDDTPRDVDACGIHEDVNNRRSLETLRVGSYIFFDFLPGVYLVCMGIVRRL